MSDHRVENIATCLHDDTPVGGGDCTQAYRSAKVYFHRVWQSSVSHRFSERILQRRIVEVAGLVRPRFVDESTGEKIAIARVTL